MLLKIADMGLDVDIKDSSIVETTVVNLDYGNPSRHSLEKLEKYLDSDEERARRMARKALERCGKIEFKLVEGVTKQDLIDKGLAKEEVVY